MFACSHFSPLNYRHLEDRGNFEIRLVFSLSYIYYTLNIYFTSEPLPPANRHKCDGAPYVPRHGRETFALSLMVAKIMHCRDYFILLSGFGKEGK